MVITGFGISCFRIETKDLSILIDPPRLGGSKSVRSRPDLLLITHDHPDHANWSLGKGEGTFVISSPGEYEFRGIPITGLATFHDKDGGKVNGRNTAFVLEVEGMRLAHLGDLADRKKLAREAAGERSLDEAIKPCDILFIPCGGKTVLTPHEAAELTRALTPKLIVPMHAPSFTPFVSELGLKLEREERISLRPSEFSGQGRRLVAIGPKT